MLLMLPSHDPAARIFARRDLYCHAWLQRPGEFGGQEFCDLKLGQHTLDKLAGSVDHRDGRQNRLIGKMTVEVRQIIAAYEAASEAVLKRLAVLKSKDVARVDHARLHLPQTKLVRA